MPRPPRPGAISSEAILVKLVDPAAREALLNSWPLTRCGLCETRAATGIWLCRFERNTFGNVKEWTELRVLCAACGLADGFLRWNGYMVPKLLRIDLAFTITHPEGSKQTPADRLIDKILEHPQGTAYIAVWRAHYKPINLHHPIQPAFLMLEALRDKLFPPPFPPQAESTTEIVDACYETD